MHTAALAVVALVASAVAASPALNRHAALSHNEESLTLDVSDPSNSGLGLWLIGDIHYDPLFDPNGKAGKFCRAGETAKSHPFGRFGCDAPWDLVTSAFDFMAHTMEPDDVILIAGDTSGHGMPSADAVLEAIDTTTKGLLDAVGSDVRVIPVVGNNDVHPHYTMECNSDTYDHWRRLGDIWSPWLSEEALAVFTEEGRGGYFAMTLEPGVRVLSINSNLWAPRLKPETTDPDPCGMKKWMEEEVEAAHTAGMKVWITGHIPPGLRGNLSGMEQKEEHVRFYTDLVLGYKDTVTLQMFAHTHMDSFRLIRQAESESETGAGAEAENESVGSAIMQAPSISPVNMNNPGVRRMQFDADAWPQDYVQYYTDLWAANSQESMEWKVEYVWSTVYGSLLRKNAGDGLTPDAITELFQELEGNNEAFARWMAHRVVSRVTDRGKYYCQLSVVNPTDLEACLKESRDDLDHVEPYARGEEMDAFFANSPWWDSQEGQDALFRAGYQDLV